MPWFALRRSRRALEVFRLGTATAAEYSQRILRTSLEQAAQRVPARVELLRGAVVVDAGLETDAAPRAEAGAVGPAQDLAGQREDERVPRPPLDVQLAVVQVLAPQLVVERVGALLLVLRRVDVGRDRGGLEAAEARAGDVRAEAQLQVEAALRRLQLEVALNGRGLDGVRLAPELERVEGDGDLHATDVAGRKPEAAEIEHRRHHPPAARARRRRPARLSPGSFARPSAPPAARGRAR